MNTIKSIAQFVSDNKMSFSLAFGWGIHMWKTVGGLTGLKSFFLTGKISPAVPQPQQQQNKQQVI